jgi:predicted alternative tryptophan synthase beta-subunit
MADARTRFLLDEDAIPTHWVNLVPDLPGEFRLARKRPPCGFRNESGIFYGPTCTQ